MMMSFFIAEGGNNIMRSWGEHDVVHMRKLDVMVGGEDGMTRLCGGRVQGEEEVEVLVGNCRIFTVALWLYPSSFLSLSGAVEHVNCQCTITL